jgi:hypothetical protein
MSSMGGGLQHASHSDSSTTAAKSTASSQRLANNSRIKAQRESATGHVLYDWDDEILSFTAFAMELA